MGASKPSRLRPSILLAAALLLACSLGRAATQPVDLDALPANAAESLCSTTVLSPFPVSIENKVTNRTNGDAFTFDWPSAGPGGFRSSVAPGTTGGVGATWVWSTDQSLYGFTGNSCPTDACFTQTSGPDSLSGFCSDACLADGTTVTVRKNGTGGIDLSWTGGSGTFTVYRGSTKIGVVAPANSVGTTSTFVFTDNPPTTSNAFYVVRGTDCTSRKACSTNADCSAPTEGTCVSRGPFGVPGRSLLANDVTVSAASLTSSLITFFSPPQRVFLADSSSSAGGVAETLTNLSSSPITVTIPAFPPGCCPASEAHPHQIRCGDACIDYLSDPNNCGACGNVCGDGSCCANGACISICGEGQTLCGGECVYLGSDDHNCGECGQSCGESSCCSDGSCHSLCGEGTILCGSSCVDPNTDNQNCGSCGNDCGYYGCCQSGECQEECGGDDVAAAPASPSTCPDTPSGTPGGCPESPFPAPDVDEAPVCQTAASSSTIPVGGFIRTCLVGGPLFKEFPTEIVVCGDSLPGVEGPCNGATSHVTTGTFNRLMPHPTLVPGNAFVTPFIVHVINDASGDGVLEPGESGGLLIEILNAGSMPITGITGTLAAPAVDLSNDGVSNPVGLTIGASAATFGSLPGLPQAVDCTAPKPDSAVNAAVFPITVPPTHPGDTSHPLVLTVHGTVGGNPFTQEVPLALGIGDNCNPLVNSGDFDGVDGLLTPMAKLVPEGDTVLFPSKAFNAGETRPLKLRVGCGGVNVTASMINPPRIVGISEATRGPIDLPGSAGFSYVPNDLLSGPHWQFNLDTEPLGTGTFTLTIEIGGRKNYVTGFVLR